MKTRWINLSMIRLTQKGCLMILPVSSISLKCNNSRSICTISLERCSLNRIPICVEYDPGGKIRSVKGGILGVRSVRVVYLV